MLKIFTNTVTGKNYDANGDLFEDGMPTIFYKATEKVYWQLCTETPDLVEDQSQTPDNTWTKSTEYAGLGAIGAFLTADSDYIKRLPGKLAVAIASGAITTISAVVNNAEQTTIPPTGVVSLFDNSGNGETVKYVSRIIGSDGSVIFSLASGSTVEHSYAVEDPMDCSQEPLAQATLDTLNSDVANGLFVFSFTAFSRKLHDLAAYSDTKEIDVRGLELAIFKIDSETNAIVDLQRYEVDTFSVRTGMAETSTNPPLTPPEENATVALVNDLLAAGFTLQYSSDGESWHDTQVTTGETIDTYFRFRSTGSGGTWSNGVRLVKGDKGDDGASAFVYIRYASDTSGTGFSATPSDSLTYIGVLATTTAIETPQASDFTGKWSLYKGPQGNPGAAGQRGTVTYFGTKVTGTSATAAVFDTDIESAMVGDSYVNTSTLNYYECTLGGADTVAKWKYVNTLKGTPGASKYQYIAYASNSSGSGFSMTPSDSLGYIAFKNSDTEITNPSASDFTGLWTKFHGNDGTSSYTYVAYASSSSGSGFSMTPSDSLKYRAEIHTTTPISSPSSSDFSGATWVKYLGDPGSNGTRGSRTNYGTAITGTSTTPTSYATGISDSLVNDQYINTDTLNLYRCTTAGNASTAKWVYVDSMKGTPAETALEGVKLNGELLTPTDKVVDVNALPIVTALPGLSDTLQDIVLYKGEDDATANPPLVKGHTYSREGEWSDSTITVKFGSNTQVLTKVGTNNVWNDTGAPGYESYQISHNGTRWVFDYSSFLYNSPACPATTMPWDDAISGATWTEQGDEGTLTVYVTRAYNGSWVDLSAQGGDGMEYLPVAKVMPTASATSEDIVFYGGEDATGVEKGHTYEKHVDYDDSTLGINWIGWTETLTKNQSGGWSNQYNTLSYSSTNGWWSFSNDYDNGQHSSQCANTVMPWDSSLTWYNNGGSTPITITFTLAVPPTYSWNDISASNEIQLNGKTQTPVNKQVNIMALPIAIDSMPTADADAQPFILFLGTTGGGYTAKHLYKKVETTDDSTITVTIGEMSYFLSGGGTSWSNSEVSPEISVYHNGTRWLMSRGFIYSGPQVPSTVKPWELNGEPWTYEGGGLTLYPEFADPTTFAWSDQGSMISAS